MLLIFSVLLVFKSASSTEHLFAINAIKLNILVRNSMDFIYIEAMCVRAPHHARNWRPFPKLPVTSATKFASEIGVPSNEDGNILYI